MCNQYESCNFEIKCVNKMIVPKEVENYDYSYKKENKKMKIIKRKFDFLRDVSKLSKRERKKYVKECSNENIHAICEAVHNVLKGHCTTKSKVVCGKLKLLQKELKKVADPSVDLTTKREILSNSQTGDGVFSIIASAVLPFLIDLLGRKK